MTGRVDSEDSLVQLGGPRGLIAFTHFPEDSDQSVIYMLYQSIAGGPVHHGKVHIDAMHAHKALKLARSKRFCVVREAIIKYPKSVK